MSVLTLRPTANAGTNNWTNTGAANAWDNLDDAVNNPTAPSTASDFISTSTTNNVAEVDLAPVSLTAGRTLNSLVANVYCATTGVRRTLTISFRYNVGGSGADTQIGSLVVPVTTAAAWQTVTATGFSGLTDAELSSLRLRFTATVSASTSTGTATVYAAYADLDYSVNVAASDTFAGVNPTDSATRTRIRDRTADEPTISLSEAAVRSYQDFSLSGPDSTTVSDSGAVRTLNAPRPTSDSVTVGADDASGSVTSPGDFITTSTIGAVAEVALEDYTLTGDQYVNLTTAEIKASTGAGIAIYVELLTGSTVLNYMTIPASSAETWFPLSYYGSLNQSQINDLRLRFTTTGTGGGVARVQAAYADVQVLAPPTTDTALTLIASAGLSPTNRLLVNRILVGIQSTAATLPRSTNKPVTATVGTSSLTARAITKTYTVSKTVTATVFRVGNRTLTATQAAVALTLRAILRTLTGTQGTSTTLPRSDLKTLTQTAVTTATLPKLLQRTLTLAQATSATIFRTGQKTVTATQATSASVLRSALRTLTGTQGTSTSVPHSTLKRLTGTVLVTVSIPRILQRTLTLAQTTTATLLRTGQRALIATQSTSASALRAIARTLTVSKATNATLTRVGAYLRTLNATVTPSSTVSRVLSRALTATTTAVASAPHTVGRALSAAQATSATLLRTGLRTLTATVVTVPSISQIGAFFRELTTNAVTQAALTRSYLKTALVTQTVTTNVTSGLAYLRSLTATVTTVVPNPVKSVLRTLLVAVTTVPTVVRTMSRTLTASKTVTAVRNSAFFRTLSAIVRTSSAGDAYPYRTAANALSVSRLWPFDEASGTSLADYKGGTASTLSGTGTTYRVTGGATSQAQNYALDVTTNGTITSPSIVLDPATGYSVVSMVRLTNITSGITPLVHNRALASNLRQFHVEYRNGGAVWIHAWDTSIGNWASAASVANTVFDNTWYHATTTVKYNGTSTTIRHYVNGTNVVSLTINANIQNAATASAIQFAGPQVWAQAGTSLAGRVQYGAIYPSELTQTQVASLATAMTTAGASPFDMPSVVRITNKLATTTVTANASRVFSFIRTLALSLATSVTRRNAVSTTRTITQGTIATFYRSHVRAVITAITATPTLIKTFLKDFPLNVAVTVNRSINLAVTYLLSSTPIGTVYRGLDRIFTIEQGQEATVPKTLLRTFTGSVTATASWVSGGILRVVELAVSLTTTATQSITLSRTFALVTHPVATFNAFRGAILTLATTVSQSASMTISGVYYRILAAIQPANAYLTRARTLGLTATQAVSAARRLVVARALSAGLTISTRVDSSRTLILTVSASVLSFVNRTLGRTIRASVQASAVTRRTLDRIFRATVVLTPRRLLSLTRTWAASVTPVGSVSRLIIVIQGVVLQAIQATEATLRRTANIALRTPQSVSTAFSNVIGMVTRVTQPVASRKLMSVVKGISAAVSPSARVTRLAKLTQSATAFVQASFRPLFGRILRPTQSTDTTINRGVARGLFTNVTASAQAFRASAREFVAAVSPVAFLKRQATQFGLYVSEVTLWIKKTLRVRGGVVEEQKQVSHRNTPVITTIVEQPDQELSVDIQNDEPIIVPEDRSIGVVPEPDQSLFITATDKKVYATEVDEDNYVLALVSTDSLPE